MKTTILQSLFKIALLLFGMVVGVGCDDSDNPDNRIQEGIEISGILAKTVENGTEIKYPTEITPFLTLRKISHSKEMPCATASKETTNTVQTMGNSKSKV